ncbi:unnamed protein product, partial [Darwinula stevensoni]
MKRRGKDTEEVTRNIVIPEKHDQLYTIHALQHDVNYPCVYALLPKRREITDICWSIGRRAALWFPIPSLNQYHSVLDDQPRSNNILEGWHQDFNHAVGITRLSTVRLAQKLQKEQHLFKNGKIKQGELDEECNSGLGTEACLDSNSECVSENPGTDPEKCKCKNTHVNDGGTCRKPVDGQCMDAAECVSNANCTDTEGAKTCTCNTNYADLDGLCIKQGAIDEECNSGLGTEACLDSNSECVSTNPGTDPEKCKCKNTHVNDGGTC